jgi:hypothetical protein
MTLRRMNTIRPPVLVRVKPVVRYKVRREWCPRPATSNIGAILEVSVIAGTFIGHVALFITLGWLMTI